MHAIVLLSFIFTFFLFGENISKTSSYTLLSDDNAFLAMLQKEHEDFVKKQEAQALRAKKALQEKQRQEKIKNIKAKLKILAQKKKVILHLLAEAEKKEALKKKQALEKKRAAQKQKSRHLFAKINISKQIMKVYKGEKLLYNWKVSTGRRGHATPRGHFKPISIEKMHHSKKYHNASMPYSVFFRSGYAVHGTRSVRHLGKPASHGCIRLRITHAKTFYNLVRKVGSKNTSIRIIN